MNEANGTKSFTTTASSRPTYFLNTDAANTLLCFEDPPHDSEMARAYKRDCMRGKDVLASAYEILKKYMHYVELVNETFYSRGPEASKSVWQTLAGKRTPGSVDSSYSWLTQYGHNEDEAIEVEKYADKPYSDASIVIQRSWRKVLQKLDNARRSRLLATATSLMENEREEFECDYSMPVLHAAILAATPEQRLFGHTVEKVLGIGVDCRVFSRQQMQAGVAIATRIKNLGMTVDHRTRAVNARSASIVRRIFCSRDDSHLSRPFKLTRAELQSVLCFSTCSMLGRTSNAHPSSRDSIAFMELVLEGHFANVSQSKSIFLSAFPLL